MAAPLPPPLPRRVSYVLPPPSAPPPLLSLPEPGVSRMGRMHPLYSQRPGRLPSPHLAKFAQEQDAAHPRHRLAVQALALDLSTALSGGGSSGRSSGDGETSPDGILYTGGRDGLLCSWELGLPTKRRRRAYGRRDPDEDANDSDSDLDASDGERETVAAMDQLGLDDLGQRPVSVASRRRTSSRTNGARPRRESSTSTTRDGGHEGFGDDSLPIEERWEVADIKTSPAPKSTFRQALQSHTDWINDIVLCNYNRTLVSASSDSLVLAWNPHSSSHEDQVTPMQVGRHGDYVRCLAAARDSHWVASGGFDRKIRLWDVGEGRASSVLELPSPPASVYSLATTPSGSLLAAGTPERVVRVWDPRSRRQVARLGGHTDNVRGVLIGEEGKWLLSASSDSTVKLWSLSAQKCLHTFSHHSSAVWSLFSQHPTLEIFYSGDRAGNVCKIDLEGTGDPGEGECILLARDGPEDEGESRSGCEGITQLVAQDDSFIWTAGGSSSVKRWKDVAPRSRRAGAIATRSAGDIPEGRELRSGTPPIAESPPEAWSERDRVGGPTVSFLEGLTSSLSRTTSSPTPHSLIASAQPGVARPSSLRTRPAATSSASQTSRPSLLQYHHSNSSMNGHSTTLFDIPYDSLVPLTSPEDTYFSPAFTNRARDPDATTIYSSASVLSVPQFGLGTRPNASTSPSSFNRRPQSIIDGAHEPAPHPTNIARRDYLDREGCNEAAPLRAEPDDVIQGRHGLVRCEVLNDRRHVLTVDTEEEIALWDIVQGRCLGVFAPDEISLASRRPSDAVSSVSGSVSTGSDSVAGADVLEFVRERIEGEVASVPSWCKCDTRVGSLTVHLEEARVFDAEVYADESGAGEPGDFPPDHRLLLGKWVLRHLFDGFIEAEMEQRAGGGTPMVGKLRLDSVPNFISLSGLSAPPPLSPATLKSPGMTIALATPALKKALLPNVPLPPPGLSPRGALFDLGSALFDLAPIPQSPGGTPRPFDPASARQGGGTPTGLRTPTAGRGEGDYFSLPPNAPTEPSPVGGQTTSLPARTPTGLPAPTPTPGGTLMGRLRQFGKNSKRPTVETDLPTFTSTAPDTTADTEEKRTIEEQQQHLILETVFARPLEPCGPLDAPPLALRNDMALIISEEKDQGAAWAVTYRGLVGTGHADLGALEQKAPMWLLDFLLGNRITSKEPTKISFLIQAWKGEGYTSLPELPNANARLTASRNLRLKKVTGYIADKLDLRTLSRAPSISGDYLPGVQPPLVSEEEKVAASVDFNPEQELEILVGDVLLPLHVTLATAQAYYWKPGGGGDLVVSYRKKRLVV